MAPSTAVFAMQVAISVTILAFGITVWFTSQDANLKSVGAGFATYVLGIWTKGYKTPSPATAAPETEALLADADADDTDDEVV